MIREFSTGFLLTLVFVLFSAAAVNAGDDNDNRKNVLLKPDFTPKYSSININNISSYFYNNGISDNSPYGNSGVTFPKGSNKQVVYQSGFIWAGKVKNEVRANGTIYTSGLLPGIILPDGSRSDENAARIYRVRKEYKNADLSSEIDNGEGTETQIRNLYEKDWNEWPANQGAPFDDKNNDGVYSPEIDIPGIPGADQTIWFAANDLDDSTSIKFLGTKPIGIELQVTIWAYREIGFLSNMFFRKYRLINKGKSTVDSMYVMMWSDADVGNASDDYVGCDTLLNLGYAYNGSSPDATYGEEVPAVGFCQLQGPAAKSSLTDSAISNGRKVAGKRNLPMTAFNYVFKSSPSLGDISTGPGRGGAAKIYNYMKGLDAFGNQIKLDSSYGGGYTKFFFSGDPVSRTGFFGGGFYYENGNTIRVTDGRQDHRLGVASGPFSLAVGDTQDVIYAEIAAGGPLSNLDRLQAVSALKKATKTLINGFDGLNPGFLVLPDAPMKPEIKFSALDREIILYWGSDQKRVEETESYNKAGFTFEGYNVYQIPFLTNDYSKAVRIATFDKINGIKYIVEDKIDALSGKGISIVKQFGSDSGIQRYLKIDHDFITNKALINGTKYYFAVTSYNYSPSSIYSVNNFESPKTLITVTPQTPDPGTRYLSASMEDLEVQSISESGKSKVTAKVIDPAIATGHQYQVEFEKQNDEYVWKVTDTQLNLLKNNSTLLSAGNNQNIIVDGILITLSDFEESIINNKWTFTSPQVITDNELAKQDIDRINVFPNPYYAANPQELDRFRKFVTFTHLPLRATIRIFNLAGELVRTIEKNSPGQFVRWDLNTEAGYQAGSGLFIVYIDMPELGKTRILKLAVIQEQFIPQYY